MLKNFAYDRLKLESIIESVGFILVPSAKYAHLAIIDLINQYDNNNTFKYNLFSIFYFIFFYIRNYGLFETDCETLKFQELNQDEICDALNQLSSNSSIYQFYITKII